MLPKLIDWQCKSVFWKKISLEKNYVRKSLTLYSPSIPVNNFSLILAGSVCMGPKRVDLLGTWTNMNLPLQMADMNWGWKLGHAQKAEGDVSSVKHGASTADTLVVACRPPWTLRRPVDPLKTNQVSQRGFKSHLGLLSEPLMPIQRLPERMIELKQAQTAAINLFNRKDFQTDYHWFSLTLHCALSEII